MYSLIKSFILEPMRYFYCFTSFLALLLPLQSNTSKQVIQEMAKVADVEVGGSRPWDIKVYNEEFYERVVRDQSLGLGESYVEGWWDSDQLDETIHKVVKAQLANQFKPSWKMMWAYCKAKVFNLQSRRGSQRVIDEHYQLGNDLFENMLDGRMTYSCGYWKQAKNLDEAQEAKYDLIAKKLYLKPGMRVLDIGCGWGGFAKFIAEKYKVSVVGITLSTNQAEYAKEVCKGLPVEIRVQDYRDMDEKFDRVVEIGMFEHVGVKNHRTFMEVTHRCLDEGGLAMVHTIGSNTSAVTGDPWIEKYIFAGGKLPSIAQIGTSIEGLFVMEDWHNFSADYDRTLMAWYARFNQNWPKLQENYSSQFYRMWKYYLLCCAATFRARHTQLWQIVLSKGGVPGGYQSVR